MGTACAKARWSEERGVMNGGIRQGLWGGAELGGTWLDYFFYENKHCFKINW